MTIHEPTTLITDLLLAGFAGFLAWRLHRGAASRDLAARWWVRVFAVTALSAFLGGTYHGFAPNFAPALQTLWWTATLVAVLVVSAMMALSLLHTAVPPDRQRGWHGLIVGKFVAFTFVAIWHPEFTVVVLDYGLVLLAWTVAALWWRRAWSRWMLAALALSVVAAGVQQTRVAPAAAFNHNDLYHVLQLLALFAFYRAAQRLGAK
ncbi:MAG: hypothetical protein Q8M02_09070 [Candidatus Didemnitutus sp.]|nr:hypothetical protein [Candidatus Didemnitutus sp.]